MADKIKADRTGVRHEKQSPDVKTCKDVYAGTKRLRKESKTYLPQFNKEPKDAYDARVIAAVLFNAFKRTIVGLVGMVMRSDPVLDPDTVPEEIAAEWEQIDLSGRHGAVVCRDLLDLALRDGHVHIFVDMPQADPEVKTALDELDSGMAPYWVPIEKQQLLRFTSEITGKEEILTSFAYMEGAITEDSETKEQVEVERVREYLLTEKGVVFNIWEKEKKKGEWELKGGGPLTRKGGEQLKRIPLVTIYAERTGFMTSNPPLLDLAEQNIKHFRAASDHQNVLHIAGVPLLYVTGMKKGDTVTAGPNFGMALPTGAVMDYAEPKGKSLPESRNNLKDIETLMAVLGLAMLQADTRHAETAKARQLDKSEKDSALMVVARSLREGIEEAFDFMAVWMGINDGDGGKVAVNKDFTKVLIDPQMVQQLSNMVAMDQLSLITMWLILQAGELLPETFTADSEKENIEMESASTLPVSETNQE